MSVNVEFAKSLTEVDADEDTTPPSRAMASLAVVLTHATGFGHSRGLLKECLFQKHLDIAEMQISAIAQPAAPKAA
ncbi:hypothetical protein VP1G_10634 [Cytospora mali]|uniref:Uncharacterized protein n=1 Tax=Cytospora mali TaxID=578113 RepID=A0A194UT26_CYTMA|nr:hypothetical protein VP1G_10634 [Valsa mali var. pyri (nom. inval.)]